MLTNQSLIAQYVGCVIDGEYTPADVCVNALPIFHCAQRDVFLTPCFMVGATSVLLFEADPGAMLEAVEKHRASMLFCPPTVWIGDSFYWENLIRTGKTGWNNARNEKGLKLISLRPFKNLPAFFLFFQRKR